LRWPINLVFKLFCIALPRVAYWVSRQWLQCFLSRTG
jgi:hypothetical protein